MSGKYCITITDDYGNEEVLTHLPFDDDEEITLNDWLCNLISPCGGCGNIILSRLAREEDGHCPSCVAEDEATEKAFQKTIDETTSGYFDDMVAECIRQLKTKGGKSWGK